MSSEGGPSVGGGRKGVQASIDRRFQIQTVICQVFQHPPDHHRPLPRSWTLRGSRKENGMPGQRTRGRPVTGSRWAKLARLSISGQTDIRCLRSRTPPTGRLNGTPTPRIGGLTGPFAGQGSFQRRQSGHLEHAITDGMPCASTHFGRADCHPSGR